MNQQEPPYIYEGYAPSTGEFSKFTDSALSVLRSVISAYQRANEPGKPLNTLANLTREAPIGSLFVAFILGVAFATRKVNPRR